MKDKITGGTISELKTANSMELALEMLLKSLLPIHTTNQPWVSGFHITLITEKFLCKGFLCHRHSQSYSERMTLES